MTTSHDTRLFYNAVLTRIANQTGKNIGDGEAPNDVTYPYAVLYPQDEEGEPEDLGTLADAHITTVHSWQVTSVGTSREQAQWMQTQVRAALLGWSPTVSGYTFGQVERDGGFGVNRDDDVQPPLFYAGDVYTLFTSAN